MTLADSKKSAAQGSGKILSKKKKKGKGLGKYLFENQILGHSKWLIPQKKTLTNSIREARGGYVLPVLETSITDPPADKMARGRFESEHAGFGQGRKAGRKKTVKKRECLARAITPHHIGPESRRGGTVEGR